MFKGLKVFGDKPASDPEMLRRAMQYLRREYRVAAFLSDKSAFCGNYNAITYCKKRKTDQRRETLPDDRFFLIVRSRSPLMSSRLPLR